MFKCIGIRLAVIGNQYFTNRYQYIITLCSYFLIDFVAEVFIIKVTVTENSFKLNKLKEIFYLIYIYL